MGTIQRTTGKRNPGSPTPAEIAEAFVLGNPPELDLGPATIDLLERRQERELDEGFLSLVGVTLHKCPGYLRRQVSRQTAGSTTNAKHAWAALLQTGVDRLNLCDEKQKWVKLRDAARHCSQEWEDPYDFEFVSDLLEEFPVSIPDPTGKPCKVNFQLDKEPHEEFQAVAAAVGLPMSTLGVICVMDALRVQDGVIHADVMESTVLDFYTRLSKRLRVTAATIQALGIRPSKDLKEALAWVEE